jgi:hypothetical protein
MRRRHFRIRRWLAVAAALVALSFASSASAMPVFDTGGGSATYSQTAPASESSGGFDWADAAIGAGVALGAALSGAGIVRVAGNRRRPAALLR